MRTIAAPPALTSAPSSRTARFVRWLPTFLGFPLGGLAAIELVGSVEGAATGAAAGALAGAILGAVQWLGLRPTGVSPALIPATAAGFAAGLAAAAAITGADTDTASLAITGAVTGLGVGLGQGPVLRRALGSKPVVLAWPLVLSAAWSLGWLTTNAIGVDVERGYAVFGSSGAILVTLLTGLALAAATRR
jgi:hypothetical protein